MNHEHHGNASTLAELECEVDGSQTQISYTSKRLVRVDGAQARPSRQRRRMKQLLLPLGCASLLASACGAVPDGHEDVGSKAQAGSYDLRASYKGSIESTRGWLVEWQIPELLNDKEAWGAVGEWYYALESGILRSPEGWFVYYFGDDNGTDGNHPDCNKQWGSGGTCRGALGPLKPGTRVALKYERCTPAHNVDVSGTQICVSVAINGGSWQFLAEDTPSKRPEMYTHDIEQWPGEHPKPYISCNAPTRMLRQELMDESGAWKSMSGAGTWDFFAADPYQFVDVALDASPSSWATCTDDAKACKSAKSDSSDSFQSTPCGELQAGKALYMNERITSCDGRFELVMQGDGNLVMYQQGKPLWASNTAGTAGELAILQTDGNLVVYAPGKPLWASGTQGYSCSRLVLQNDGNLVVYSGNDQRLWASNTCCR